MQIIHTSTHTSTINILLVLAPPLYPHNPHHHQVTPHNRRGNPRLHQPASWVLDFVMPTAMTPPPQAITFSANLPRSLATQAQTLLPILGKHLLVRHFCSITLVCYISTAMYIDTVCTVLQRWCRLNINSPAGLTQTPTAAATSQSRRGGCLRAFSDNLF